MDENERLRQIMSKLAEIGELAKSLDTNECDRLLVAEARGKLSSIFLSMKSVNDQNRPIRTADGGYLFRGKRYPPNSPFHAY